MRRRALVWPSALYYVHQTLSRMLVTRRARATLFAFGGALLGTLLVATGTVRAGLDQISRFLSLQGSPEPASANVLSEHEIEVLDSMPPQSQAELLLERSINHYAGANEQIASRVGKWRAEITLNDRLHNLFTTAINSDDLRVRAAGIEIDIAARKLDKSSATVDRLEPDARSGYYRSDTAARSGRLAAVVRQPEINLTFLARPLRGRQRVRACEDAGESTHRLLAAATRGLSGFYGRRLYMLLTRVMHSSPDRSSLPPPVWSPARTRWRSGLRRPAPADRRRRRSR